ncbi:MAG: phosphotransferase [Acinetobacter populi]|jgi:aminoglycoside/choline kinase family phosphotransferase|uniref:aminoglycoside phosphotransferase family protein n=1 Tax=Acinetobacter populi TaxID=1582270 RepID=UPI00235582F8|nr:phosphotransferase [Acinetobacter populi]MCH4246522.1 phosphotransferase [Acinetobacter populi]
MQREQIVQQWLEQIIEKQAFEIKYLQGDASFRRYARIYLPNQTYMLMDAPPEKEDCLPFVQIAAYLEQHGARVPHIIAQDLSQGFLLLEDFGDHLLANALNAQTVDAYYLKAFKQIIQLQAIPVDPLIFPKYSIEKLIQEMRLFDQWMLPDLKIEVTEKHAELLHRSYQWIIENLEHQPQVLVHRDYHSRNLMILDGENDLGVIDFQDAVVGPDTYDLISIIRDAYVQWPSQQVQKWIAEFYAMLPEQARKNRDLAQFKLDAEIMSIQRHLKILGIFVRLYVRDGKSGYLKDLPRVMWYLRHELAHCSALQDFQQFIEMEVMPAFIAKYGEYTELGDVA